MTLQVVRRPSATAEPSDMMVMKLSLVMEEVIKLHFRLDNVWGIYNLALKADDLNKMTYIGREL